MWFAIGLFHLEQMVVYVLVYSTCYLSENSNPPASKWWSLLPSQPVTPAGWGRGERWLVGGEQAARSGLVLINRMSASPGGGDLHSVPMKSKTGCAPTGITRIALQHRRSDCSSSRGEPAQHRSPGSGAGCPLHRPSFISTPAESHNARQGQLNDWEERRNQHDSHSPIDQRLATRQTRMAVACERTLCNAQPELWDLRWCTAPFRTWMCAIDGE